MNPLDRRDFMAALLRFSGVSAAAGASSVLSAAGVGSAPDERVLVLHRAGHAEGEAFAQVWAEAGFATQALAPDVVRQWRDSLGAAFGAGRRLLVGLGNWDDQVLLQGLAAEQRRHPLLVLQHPLEAQQSGWAAAHALELQALLLQASAVQQEQALQALARRGSLQPATPSLFSWVLG